MNHLAFIPYMIPGSPSETVYQECMGILQELGATLFETTIPARSGWSGHTNATIREFHTASTQNLTQALDSISHYRPNLLVLYEGTLENIPFETLADLMVKKVDSLILEWAEPQYWTYQATCEVRGIEFIHSIHPDQTEEEMVDILTSVSPGSFLYLLSADRTGGKLYAPSDLTRTVHLIKGHRPDIFVLAGFGIQDPSQIRALRAVDGLDGVIVGTALLEASKKGIPVFRNLVSEMLRACGHT